MKTDDTDKKILNMLIRRSNMSCRQISRKLGVSAVTVLKRIKTLEKEGIIRRYTAELDYDKLGYDIPAIIKMRIVKGRYSEVEKKIAPNPNIFAIYDITGDFDSIVIAKFKSRKSIDAFLKKIQTYDFIERVETHFVLNTIKESHIEID